MVWFRFASNPKDFRSMYMHSGGHRAESSLQFRSFPAGDRSLGPYAGKKGQKRRGGGGGGGGGGVDTKEFMYPVPCGELVVCVTTLMYRLCCRTTWGCRTSVLCWPKLWATLCCARLLPGRKSAFRAEFRPDSRRECLTIGPPAGRRTDFDAFPIRIWAKSGQQARFSTRKHYCRT